MEPPWEVAERLRSGEGAVDDAIAYLEADPWEFRSGYAKALLLRRLKHAPLADAAKSRLERVLLRYVDVGPRWDFREACTLARRIDSEALRQQLRIRLHGADMGVAARATTMLLRLHRPALTDSDLKAARQALAMWAARPGWLGRAPGGEVRRLWSREWGRELRQLARSDDALAAGARKLLREAPHRVRQVEADP